MKFPVKILINAATAFAILVSAMFAQVPEQAKIVAIADQTIDKAAKAGPAATPGCAVGISLGGKSIYEKAFGMADIEHSVPNTPQTIFESGSVAKQFTAAAIIVLSLEGKLGLDDPVRKYIPELPDYGTPLTIRHLLNHTGGLRDWGTVMGLTGVGRGDRVISQDLALDVIVHQKALDFTPGSEYSYTNSGYNTLARIVERVSGQKFPDFTAQRFFKPLGMGNSSWRDDYQRIVPGRAQAYEGPLTGPFRLSMPFMNVYGNGGMLTTIGDWLKWNEMLDSRSLGTPLVEVLETRGVLTNGRKIPYASGIVVSEYKGRREISHNGSTAGYQTYLGRYPDQKLSIAVMCNGASFNPTAMAHTIFDGVIDAVPGPVQPDKAEVKPDDLQKYASIWRNGKTHMPARTIVDNGVLRMANGPVLSPLKDGTFQVGQGGARWKFETDAAGKIVGGTLTSDGEETRLIAEQEWKPSDQDLKSFEGEWYSEEASAGFTFTVTNGNALFVQRPATRISLLPLYKDHFALGGFFGPVVWLTRDSAGRVTNLHVGSGRMRDMPFARSVK